MSESNVQSSDDTRIDVLRTLITVFASPDRLIRAVGEADSDDQATAALCREFDITETQARLVVDQQIRLLTRARLETMKRDLDAALSEQSPEADIR